MCLAGAVTLSCQGARHPGRAELSRVTSGVLVEERQVRVGGLEQVDLKAGTHSRDLRALGPGRRRTI